jgi:hypothetical protein
MVGLMVTVGILAVAFLALKYGGKMDVRKGTEKK